MYFKFEDYLWYQSKTTELEPWLSFKKDCKNLYARNATVIRL